MLLDKLQPSRLVAFLGFFYEFVLALKKHL